MGGYLSILLLLSFGLWVPPLVSSCKGTIHFRNADGEKVTAVENAPLTLEVHVNFTCNEEVTNLRVALSKRMKSGRYIDVCSVHQIGEQCSSWSKDACDCLEGDRETGRLYKFQRTARLQDRGQWRVKAEGNVRAEAFITFEVQEPSSTALTTKVEGTTVPVPEEEDEKTTMASGGSTKTDNAQDKTTLDFEEEAADCVPDRSLSEEMIHPFFTSIFGYGTLGLLGLALLFIFIVTIVIITRKGKREKSPKKAKQRQKPRQPSDVMSIQSSDAGYDTISASGASVLYDDIVLDRHAAEEAHLRVQRPLPPYRCLTT